MKYAIKIIVIIFVVVIILNFTGSIRAEVQSTATSGANISEQSFEIFWPLSPGITSDQPLYLLKTFKETIRGILIFGEPEKANYKALLANKRFLEAIKLMQENKIELANKTLTASIYELDMVEKSLISAKKKKEPLGRSGKDILNKLNNLETIGNILIETNDGLKNQLQNLLRRVENLKLLLK